MNDMIKKHRTCSKVNTFAELSQFGRLAEEWCIDYGEDIFDLYTDGGRKTLFVIQTDDALSVERKMGANFPKDDYGLSFIAVYVDRGGRVVSVLFFIVLSLSFPCPLSSPCLQAFGQCF